MPRSSHFPKWATREADLESIPDVDGADGKCKVHLLRFSEFRLHQLIVGVRRMGVGEPGQRPRSGERRSLTRRVEEGFAPGVEHIDAHLAFALFAQIGGVQSGCRRRSH